jgi:hypothetical protein
MKSIEDFCRRIHLDTTEPKDYPDWIDKHIGTRKLLVKRYWQGHGSLPLTNLGETLRGKDIALAFTNAYWGIKFQHSVSTEIVARQINAVQRDGRTTSEVWTSLTVSIPVGGFLLLCDKTTALLLYGGQDIPSKEPKYEQFRLDV